MEIVATVECCVKPGGGHFRGAGQRRVADADGPSKGRNTARHGVAREISKQFSGKAKVP